MTSEGLPEVSLPQADGYASESERYLGKSMLSGLVALGGIVAALVGSPDLANNKPTLLVGVVLYFGGTASGLHYLNRVHRPSA